MGESQIKHFIDITDKYRRDLENVRNNIQVRGCKVKINIHEHNYVVRFAMPLVELLGWDLGADVLLEAPILLFRRKGEKTKKVDAALLVRNRYKVIIEVKRSLENNLYSPRHQIHDYLHNSDASYGILIDHGKLVFCRKFGVRKDARNPGFLFELWFKDFEKYPDLLELLTKQSILGGTTDRFLKAYGKIYLELARDREKVNMKNPDWYDYRLKLFSDCLKVFYEKKENG